MTTRDDAWDWYVATRDGATHLARLSRYWGELPWDAGLPGLHGIARDERLRSLQPDAMKRGADRAREGLEDLAVLVLFGVFEAVVRGWIEDRVRPEVERLRDPTLRKAGEDALDAVAQGSFGRLLEAYKALVGADLVEQVSQVRRYRNWVAHGRRSGDEDRAKITPDMAFDRLKRFLAALQGGKAS